MAFSFFGAFLLLFIEGLHADICEPCFCEPPVAVCYINSCESGLVRDPSIEIIQIYGKMCRSQIEALQDIFYHNTIVELIDEWCPGHISNCRFVF